MARIVMSLSLRVTQIFSDRRDASMLRLLEFSLILLLPLSARAEDAAALNSQANAAYQAKDYARSAALYADAIKAGASPRVPAYNAACCYALLARTDEAFIWLDKSLDAGWRDVEHLRADTDLQSLHVDPRWEATVKRCQELEAAFAQSLKEPALRTKVRVFSSIRDGSSLAALGASDSVFLPPTAKPSTEYRCFLSIYSVSEISICTIPIPKGFPKPRR